MKYVNKKKDMKKKIECDECKGKGTERINLCWECYQKYLEQERD